MVGTSKILTVSYGTFSCTLEGFDDSFNTMKAIAEYFRGLASDDRYFGAEPPTPDAEMLAQIAEREISRRVDASLDDTGTGIVLRAAALTDQSDASDDDTSKAKDDGHDAESRAKVDAERKAKKAARKAEKAKAKAAKKAAKAAAKAERDAQAEADKADAEKIEADAKADDASSAKGETSLLESVSAATADASEGDSESDAEETRDDALSSTLAALDSAPDTTTADSVPAHPDPDSVAAKLQRIRAVVKTPSDTSKDADHSDDLAEQFLPQDEAPDVADDAAGSTDDAMDGSDMMSRVMAGEPDSDSLQSEDAAADQPHSRVVRMKRSDFDKAVTDGDMADAQPAGPDFGLLDGADDLDDYLEDSDFTDADMEFSPDADNDTDIDADLADDLKAIQDDGADGTADDMAEDAAEDVIDAVADTTDGGVETEDEDEDTADGGDNANDAVSSMMAGLVSIEDDAEVEDDEDETSEDEMSVAAEFSSDEPQVDDEALDRLMSESEAQMQEPEGSRRRDAITQLKAAVAAKEAARQAGETDDDGQDVENAFRNDLSEVVQPEGAVRPRPVLRDQKRTERPRPAPLKLVAAQRIDMAEPVQNDAPVVPRRVALRKDDAQSQSSASFAEFAENMGASELPDLLEAAAAYTSFVEGADEFSRPQILRRVRAVASNDFNREDGLRSFADLLKAGRFTKVRNGRFQVADDSRFNPEQRAG